MSLADKKYFFVEGATGVGKTTFVRLLEKNIPEAAIVYEPVDTFTDVNGAGNILEFIYNNPKRWTFTAQIYFALMHTKAVEQAAQQTNKKIIISDTSIYADYHVFTKMMYALGDMNTMELAVYQEFFSWITQKNAIKASGFIYLDAPPQVALERVKSRARVGEQPLDFRYQENLSYYYKQVISEENKELNVPVLNIDAQLNFKDDPKIQKLYIDQVKAFIERLS